MNYQEFEKKFLEELKQNNIKSLTDIENFYKYMNIILDWNTKINVTAIKNPDEFISKHFIDSLIVAKYIKDNDVVIDVGTGAGFPGIPLKLYNNNIFVTLLDSVSKKIMIVNDVIEKLKLENIEAIHARAEEFIKDNREKYNVAVSRAVANMSTLVEYLIPFVKIGGIIICMKGPSLDEELANAEKAINVLGGTIEKIDTFNIDGEMERNIVIIRKTRPTPKVYPRGQSKPLKSPIK